MGNNSKIWFLCILVSVIVACKDKPFVEPLNPHDHSNMAVIDTFPVNISTTKIDSFLTSDMQNIFTGVNNDPNTGNLKAVSYIPFTFDYNLPQFSAYDTAKLVYDSLILYMRQNGEYWGDTNILRTIHVYRVLEDIEPGRDDYDYDLYNRRSFQYDSVPLTTLNFYAPPKSQNLLRAHLPDSLGKRWLQASIDRLYHDVDTCIFDSPSSFLEYFKGIALVPDSRSIKSWGSTFIGSKKFDHYQGDSEIEIKYFEVRLYYHLQDEDYARIIRFNNPNSSNLFTSFLSDFSNTGLEKGRFIPSSTTGNMAYIQGGSGLLLKINLQYLEQIEYLDIKKPLLDAVLTIRPKERLENDFFPLPKNLYVWVTDSIQWPYEYYSEGSPVIAELAYDGPTNDEPYYQIPMMEFIDGYLSRKYSYMVLSLSKTETATSFTTLKICDQQLDASSVKLELFFPLKKE